MILFITLTEEQKEEIINGLAATLGPAIGQRDGYSAAETANRLDVSKVTVERRIKAGIIPIIPGISPARVPADYVARMMKSKDA